MTRTLNLGILAHVDAGKTSLTERLLYAAGIIDEIGSVDDGNTQTDTLALERERGITIKSAVVSFALGDLTVNLIDTPGHPDFIAEVDRVLGVLDGAILVVSAVEGVQAQTRTLLRALRRLNVPTLIFVNKIDRPGARYAGLLDDLAAKLTPVAVALGTVRDIGTAAAEYLPSEPDDPSLRHALLDTLAEHDDRLLADFVRDEGAVCAARLRAALVDQTAHALVYPVVFGSAITGAGTDALIDAVQTLLPAVAGDPDAPVAGKVFKIERGPGGARIAYARIDAGTLRVRDTVEYGCYQTGRITALHVFEQGATIQRRAAYAGEIAMLMGLSDIRIGDGIGRATTSAGQHFARPTLETLIEPCCDDERGLLHIALAQLAEQDPLINLRQDADSRQILVSLYGAVQQEVIAATLADDYGLAVEFRDTTTLHIERPVGSGAACEIINKGDNPFLATVGLRVDPAPLDSGVEFRLEVELGSMPLAFFNAVEEAVRDTLGQGLYGWEVTDCTVTMTHAGYWARQSSAHGGFDKSMSSTAGDFRLLTPLVLMDALRQAGTTVCEPVDRFRLEFPEDTYGPVLPALARHRAVPDSQVVRGSSCIVEGEIPTVGVQELRQQLPSLTRGEGVLECAFERFQPVNGQIPCRPRTDYNPLKRKEYLLHVQRRV